VYLPKFAHPEIASPVKTFLLLPVARLIVALSEKTRALISGDLCSRRALEYRFPLFRRALGRLAQEIGCLSKSFLTRGLQRVSRRGLRRGARRQENNLRRMCDPAAGLAGQLDESVKRFGSARRRRR